MIWAVHGMMNMNQLLVQLDLASGLIYSECLHFDMIWEKRSKKIIQDFKTVCFTNSFSDGTFKV